MLWQLRALLDDRPGAMAALAASCGEQNINILGLQIFPAADGRVVDEVVVHTPGGWDAGAVERLCIEAGLADATVAPCSPHALEDQPVRYLRAAQAVAARPELLEEQLCGLLDASAEGTAPYSLVLDDEAGPYVRLGRGVAFTDTELARATELRRLAAVGAPAMAGSGAAPARATTIPAVPAAVRPGAVAGPEPVPGAVSIRRGEDTDADALLAMHDRCSEVTITRRFHSPVARLTARMVGELLEPEGGFSILVTNGRDVVAAGMVGALRTEDDVHGVCGEVALMVEDRYQRKGHGAKLLRALATEAAGAGFKTLVCVVQPDNDAVLRTIRRAGLRALVSYVDGLVEYRIRVDRLRGRSVARKRTRRPEMGSITAPLVDLLHGRRELREVYPPADLIDQAVRGGA